MDKLPEAAVSRQSLIEKSQDLSAEAKKLHANRCAKILLGCYRTGDANDPEVYVRSVVAILCGYPIDVIEAVCSPLNGLPAQIKWLPTLAEVREACEKLAAPQRRADEWNERAERQLAEREALKNQKKSRPTYAEMRAKYDGPNGEKWGISGDFDKPTSSHEAARKKLISQFGRAVFDAIPNRPGADYRGEGTT